MARAAGSLSSAWAAPASARARQSAATDVTRQRETTAPVRSVPACFCGIGREAEVGRLRRTVRPCVPSMHHLDVRQSGNGILITCSPAEVEAGRPRGRCVCATTTTAAGLPTCCTGGCRGRRGELSGLDAQRIRPAGSGGRFPPGLRWRLPKVGLIPPRDPAQCARMGPRAAHPPR